MSELGWDYAAVRRVLFSFIERKLLPGYVALDQSHLLGYTYFLTHKAKGIIGTIYVSRIESSQAVADEMLSLAVNCLKEASGIRRIESQVIPLNNLNLAGTFTRHGFRCHTRYYLELELNTHSPLDHCASIDMIVPWNPALLSAAARVTLESYRDQPDAGLCEDYCTPEGCQGYLHSLQDNPGCGTFMPEASFMGLDGLGALSGFLINSRISATSGMIPQVAILPSHQGHGLGNALMQHCLSYFKTNGYRTVSLTVTKKNQRAFQWYRRLGFRIQREFEAFVWER